MLLFMLCLSLGHALALNQPTLNAATPNKPPAALKTTIDALLADFPYPMSIGIRIQSMETGKILYEKNSDHFFTPASTLKLFTAAAAERYLGHNFTFATEVLASKAPKNQRLSGDLVFHFSGDPTLTRADLKALVATLADIGITSITGHIYIDDSTFDQVGYGPGWMWDELNFCYGAPVSSIMIGKNCFHRHLHPSASLGHLALIDTPSRASVILPSLTPIINSVLTQPPQAAAHCPLRLQASDLNIYHLSGCITQNTPTKTLDIAIKNIRQYTATLLKSLFAQYHIQINPTIRFGTPLTPAHILLARHESAPLPVILTHMLKHSDNLIADALYKKLGAQYFQQPGSWKNGARAIAAILTEPTGINFSHLALVDGAGLSRYNLITPAQLALLLDYIYHNADLLQTLLPALPESGIDGTLRQRMTNQTTLGRVYAKTGTMTGGSSLAGYIISPSGQTLSFVIMVNNYLGKAKVYQKLEDRIVAGVLAVRSLS